MGCITKFHLKLQIADNYETGNQTQRQQYNFEKIT